MRYPMKTAAREGSSETWRRWNSWAILVGVLSFSLKKSSASEQYFSCSPEGRSGGGGSEQRPPRLKVEEGAGTGTGAETAAIAGARAPQQRPVQFPVASEPLALWKPQKM